MIGRLHERERDLGVIAGAFDEVAAGSGRVVVVEGPAGIGKTSLLESARDAARARNFAVAWARGSELERAYAWGVVRQLLEPRLRGISGAERTRTLAGAAALAAPIVLPDGAAPPGDADPSFGVLHGLYWLVAALAERRPQLLVVDDLHWADGASVRFLEFLANRIDAVPALVLVAQRPGAGGALRGAPLVTSVEPSPLSSDATAAVVAEHNGAPVSAAFAQACHGATGRQPAAGPPAGGGAARARHRWRRRRRRGGGDAPGPVRGRGSGGRGAGAAGRGSGAARARRRGARERAAGDRGTAGRRRPRAGVGVRRAARACRDPARRPAARVRARARARRGAERAHRGRAGAAACRGGAHPGRGGSGA